MPTSQYRGVCWDKASSKWLVQISADGKMRHVGRFAGEEAAARAYDAKAKELWVNPVLNFLPDGSLNPDRKTGPSGRHLTAVAPSSERGSTDPNSNRRSSSSDEGGDGESDSDGGGDGESDSDRGSSICSGGGGGAGSAAAAAAATADAGGWPSIIDMGSLLAIVDFIDGSDDERAAEAAVLGARKELGPAADVPAVVALQSYASFTFVDLDLGWEGGSEEGRAYATALRLLAMGEGAAIPFLREVVARMDLSNDNDAAVRAQLVRLFMGSIQSQGDGGGSGGGIN